MIKQKEKSVFYNTIYSSKKVNEIVQYKRRSSMSHIKVRCNKCSNIHQIDAKEIVFEAVESTERQMGAEIRYEGECDFNCNICENFIEINQSLWEYPVGAKNHKETKISGGLIIESELIS